MVPKAGKGGSGNKGNETGKGRDTPLLLRPFVTRSVMLYRDVIGRRVRLVGCPQTYVTADVS